MGGVRHSATKNQVYFYSNREMYPLQLTERYWRTGDVTGPIYLLQDKTINDEEVLCLILLIDLTPNNYLFTH